MNIDTIMEEESIQKAIYEKTYLPHKVQMIEIPNKPKKMHNIKYKREILEQNPLAATSVT